MIRGDSLQVLRDSVKTDTVDLIVTSPPYGLVRKKDYGNVPAEEYVDWFRPFGEEFKRVLKPSGSLVIDIGGAWVPGTPTRSLYHYELLIMLCREVGFHLAQEIFWWNPSRLPTPAEWVNVRRIRVKDAVDCIWWLSPTPWPKASNTRVLQPYSDSMRSLLKNGYKAKLRPSGHDISTKFQKDNGASIPPNLLALAHTESNSPYLAYCRAHGIKPNPARFPEELPEYFIRMLSDKGDLVLDPFAGSCATGAVAQRLKRRWMCVEICEDYLRGALGRFTSESKKRQRQPAKSRDLFEDQAASGTYYSIPRPDLLWDGTEDESPLREDGGRTRPRSKRSRSKDK
jgi:site-specific DNA-methyltransferase (cytosine-N4-specific)